MATYIFGDLHGCYDEFSKLLHKIDFTAGKDELYLTGDLIGRGPHPEKTLDTIINLKQKFPDKIHCVLGNHDLNFLAITAGFHSARKKDNLEGLLASEKLDRYLQFYYSTPLIYIDHSKKLAVSHAGVYPMWDLEEAQKHSDAFSAVLADPLTRKLFLSNMYADHPVSYTKELEYSDLNYWRFIVNAFTRMRLCDKKLNLDYGHSDCSLKEAEKDHLYPWFKYGKPYMYRNSAYTLAFGHWAALNAECNEKNIIALDTGCVWGNKLTCLCVENGKKTTVKSGVKIEFSSMKKSS